MTLNFFIVPLTASTKMQVVQTYYKPEDCGYSNTTQALPDIDGILY